MKKKEKRKKDRKKERKNISKQVSERKKERKKVSWLVEFYGISNFVGYLTPKPFYANIPFYFKQFSLTWVHSLIVKNIPFFKLFSLIKQFYFKQLS